MPLILYSSESKLL